MTNSVKYTRIAGMPFQVQQGEINLKAMSNGEVKRRAIADPDAALIDSKDFNKFKRVNPFPKK